MPDWHDVEGWFTDADAEALRSLLARVPEGGATAHVGVFQGRHLAACADVFRDRRLSVLAVDTFRGSDDRYVTVGGEGGNAPANLLEVINWTAVAVNFGRMSTLFDFGGPVQATVRSSLHAAGQCRHAGRSFDLVFIDADHGYEHVVADIMAWRSLVKPGGILCGHDYGNPDYPGVQRAVREQLPGWCREPGESSVWYWTRPEQQAG